MDFTIESAGDVASTVRIGGHTLRFDQPSPHGGDIGPSPLDVLVASVGACAHYFAAAALKARRITTHGLTVRIIADKAVEGPPRLEQVQITVTVPDVSDRVMSVVEAAVRRCPAFGTLQTSPALSLTVVRAELTR